LKLHCRIQHIRGLVRQQQQQRIARSQHQARIFQLGLCRSGICGKLRAVLWQRQDFKQLLRKFGICG
jgi:hypothetical protein